MDPIRRPGDELPRSPLSGLPHLSLKTRYRLISLKVQVKGFEPSWSKLHNALNVTRIPVPPHLLKKRWGTQCTPPCHFQANLGIFNCQRSKLQEGTDPTTPTHPRLRQSLHLSNSHLRHPSRNRTDLTRVATSHLNHSVIGRCELGHSTDQVRQSSHLPSNWGYSLLERCVSSTPNEIRTRVYGLKAHKSFQ